MSDSARIHRTRRIMDVYMAARTDQKDISDRAWNQHVTGRSIHWGRALLVTALVVAGVILVVTRII